MYYFTFGNDGCGQVFTGGWVRIRANSCAEAQDKFIARYGKRAWKHEHCLNYAFDYPESRFKETGMLEGGNLGKFEHEYIP